MKRVDIDIILDDKWTDLSIARPSCNVPLNKVFAINDIEDVVLTRLEPKTFEVIYDHIPPTP